MGNKDTIIEALTMQLRLEREGNLALAKRNCDNCESLRKAARDRINELEAKLEEREWVGLTVEDIDDLWKTEYFNLHYELPKAIQAKLKEKNCGWR